MKELYPYLSKVTEFLEVLLLKNTKPIIIGGCMRSGTTLLSAIIDSHPNIACGFETEIFTVSDILQTMLYRFKLADGVSERIFPTAYKKIKHRLHIYPHMDSYSIENLYHNCSKNRAEFASAFFSEYARKKGKLRWAEKSLGNTFHIHTLKRLLPSALFVHIVRDFRDVYLSIKKYTKNRERSYSIFRAAYYYRRNALVYKQSKEMQNRCMIIRYEDLILSFQYTLQILFKFLGEDMLEKCQHFWKYQHDISRKTHVSKAQEAIDKSNCFKYRQELSKSDQKLSWILCGEVMRLFDYHKD